MGVTGREFSPIRVDTFYTVRVSEIWSLLRRVQLSG